MGNDVVTCVVLALLPIDVTETVVRRAGNASVFGEGMSESAFETTTDAFDIDCDRHGSLVVVVVGVVDLVPDTGVSPIFC